MTEEAKCSEHECGRAARIAIDGYFATMSIYVHLRIEDAPIGALLYCAEHGANMAASLIQHWTTPSIEHIVSNKMGGAVPQEES